MANASAKRIAQQNRAFLALHRRISVMLYVICFVFFRWAKRHFFLQILFTTPAMLAQYLLEQWCTPKVDANKKLISPGQDSSSEGLIDYIKDVIYLTWITLLCSVAFGFKAWLLMLLVPAFVAYKAFSLLKAGMGLLGGKQSQSQPQRQ